MNRALVVVVVVVLVVVAGDGRRRRTIVQTAWLAPAGWDDPDCTV
jgi:hypothetical protein